MTLYEDCTTMGIQVIISSVWIVNLGGGCFLVNLIVQYWEVVLALPKRERCIVESSSIFKIRCLWGG